MEGEMKKKLLNKVEKPGGEIEVDDEGEEGHEQLKDKLWSETKKLWVVAGPAIFARFSTFGVNIISQAFIGHIGSTELAAYALVATVLLRFANGILLGMSNSLQTLCGQSFGAKQYHMLGIYLQRSWLVLTITSLFLLPLFIFTAPILKALGQEEEIAQVAGYISRWLIPVMFAFNVSFTCQMYLQAQSKNMTIAYLAAFSLVVHVFLSWLLAVKLKFGLEGVLASTALAYWIPNIGQLMFIFYGGCPETWKGFSSLAFKDLWPVIKLSLSSGVMVCLELWYNTILVLLTGNMKNAQVAIDALSICLNINGWEMMISFGFLAAARGHLAYIFTDSHDVARAVAGLSPLLACSMLLNSVQPFSQDDIFTGVAVGAGWQSIVACVNVASYYLIGIPIGVVLGYTINLQVKGVWMGMLIGTFLQTVVLIIITYRTDWEKQVSRARARVNQLYLTEPKEADPNMQDV
ncbi:Protein detoxification 21 [Vitis vinifera]|uniref:Protein DETOXIFICATION n=1 Tax=Vitis vinifera TaxID=29760 RepID=A0A438DHH7_VITVI|nr:Protein detoxification 21 [Vitis vinifera]